MDDKQLRQNVLDALEFEPSINAVNIGVAVDDSVVTLSGHVSSYAEKTAAERVARQVKGARAIAQEIEVRYPSGHSAKGMGDPRRRGELAISEEGRRGYRSEIVWRHQRDQSHLAQADSSCIRHQEEDRGRAGSTREHRG
jgi:BON domain